MADRDLELKELLLNYGEHVLVSVYDGDQTHKNRRNTKRARILEKIIIENGFPYKKIVIDLPNRESVHYFVVYGNEEKIKAALNEEPNHFKLMTFFDDEKFREILEETAFHHPVTAKEKEECRARHEIFLENLYEPPSSCGGWNYYSSYGDCSFHYIKNNLHCFIYWVQEKNVCKISIGSTRPVGVSLDTLYAGSREEAFEKMAAWTLQTRLSRRKQEG